MTTTAPITGRIRAIQGQPAVRHPDAQVKTCGRYAVSPQPILDHNAATQTHPKKTTENYKKAHTLKTPA
jgi:hypothetical protein